MNKKQTGKKRPRNVISLADAKKDRIFAWEMDKALQWIRGSVNSTTTLKDIPNGADGSPLSR